MSEIVMSLAIKIELILLPKNANIRYTSININIFLKLRNISIKTFKRGRVNTEKNTKNNIIIFKIYIICERQKRSNNSSLFTRYLLLDRQTIQG